jgi:putative ABC transport system substrate-binding protein
MSDMRRREFITLLGGAVAWPFAVRAQNKTKRASLGYLSGTFETEAKPFIGIFLEGLRRQGYIEGRDFDIAYRFAEGQ